MEQQHWNTEPTDHDAKLQQAGVKELEQFGDLPMIDSLAGGDILRYNDIEKLNYLEVHYIWKAKYLKLHRLPSLFL